MIYMFGDKYKQVLRKLNRTPLKPYPSKLRFPGSTPGLRYKIPVFSDPDPGKS